MSTKRKIRLIIEPCLNMLGKVIYLLSLPRVARYIGELYALFYTAYIRNAFKMVGKGVVIYPTITKINAENIEIGELTQIKSNVILSTWNEIPNKTPNLVIGQNCNIGEYTHISCANKITIGDGVLTGRWVTIVDNSHGHLCKEQESIIPSERPIESAGEVYIGKNVWLGDKVTILPNVKIGDGCIIGANSVVAHDVPANSIVAGSPAKIIKTL